MDRPLREYISMAVSVIITGTIIFTIVFFTQIGYSFLTINNEQRAFKAQLAEERGLALYRDTVITKGDILTTVRKYAKEYNILIQPNVSSEDETEWRENWKDVVGNQDKFLEDSYGKRLVKVDSNDFLIKATDDETQWTTGVISQKLDTITSSTDALFESQLFKNTSGVITLVFTFKGDDE